MNLSDEVHKDPKRLATDIQVEHITALGSSWMHRVVNTEKTISDLLLSGFEKCGKAFQDNIIHWQRKQWTTEQNSSAFQPIFEKLGVNSKIKYCTIKQHSEENIEGSKLKDLAEALIREQDLAAGATEHPSGVEEMKSTSSLGSSSATPVRAPALVRLQHRRLWRRPSAPKHRATQGPFSLRSQTLSPKGQTC